MVESVLVVKAPYCLPELHHHLAAMGGGGEEILITCRGPHGQAGLVQLLVTSLRPVLLVLNLCRTAEGVSQSGGKCGRGRVVVAKGEEGQVVTFVILTLARSSSTLPCPPGP